MRTCAGRSCGASRRRGPRHDTDVPREKGITVDRNCRHGVIGDCTGRPADFVKEWLVGLDPRLDALVFREPGGAEPAATERGQEGLQPVLAPPHDRPVVPGVRARSRFDLRYSLDRAPRRKILLQDGDPGFVARSRSSLTRTVAVNRCGAVSPTDWRTSFLCHPSFDSVGARGPITGSFSGLRRC